ncbi:MAG TPA: TniQ family protein, partial [Thermodesulfobacteriota bacterium]|nr:TniQ family protein [Thermodesulfobacteriota bacterium]
MLASAHGLSRTLLSRSTYACLTTRRNGVPLHRYCPACLDEDDTPYLRLRWRLAYEVVCERHRCLLLDRCPGCRRHIDFSGLLKRKRPTIAVLPVIQQSGLISSVNSPS